MRTVISGRRALWDYTLDTRIEHHEVAPFQRR